MKDQNDLLAKLSKAERKDWEETKKTYYHSRTILSEEYGSISFSDDDYKDTVHSTPLSYDEFLDLQRMTVSKCRHSFQQCFYESWGNSFKGEIEKVTSNRVCFKRIYVIGTYSDGICFSGKEDHVWMDRKGFENFEVGQAVTFTADVYRYVKIGNGKAIDFGLKNPDGIREIDAYELPTDRQLLEKNIDQMICDEFCMFKDHCYMGNCIANSKWRMDLRNSMIEVLLKNEK